MSFTFFSDKPFVLAFFAVPSSLVANVGTMDGLELEEELAGDKTAQKKDQT